MDEGDSELIDRGFRALAMADIARAVMTLQNADVNDDMRSWARMVLERLPEDEKATPAK